MMKRALLLMILFTVLAFLASCTAAGNRPDAGTPVPSPSVAVTAPSASPEAGPESKIVIDDGSGKTLYTLMRREGKYRILDADGKIIGEVKVEADRVKIKDKSGKVLWKIKKKDNGCKLTSGTDAELYKIKGSNGDFKMKDSRDSEVARVKIKGNYLEISGMGNGKVKSEGEGIKIEDNTGTLLFSAKTGLTKEEGCFLGLTSLEPLQRIGLVIFYKEIR